jgi:hypothetical protein
LFFVRLSWEWNHLRLTLFTCSIADLFILLHFILWICHHFFVHCQYKHMKA